MDVQGVTESSDWEGFCQADFDGGLLSSYSLGCNTAPTCTEEVQNLNLDLNFSSSLDGVWTNSCATTSEDDFVDALVSALDEGHETGIQGSGKGEGSLTTSTIEDDNGMNSKPTLQAEGVDLLSQGTPFSDQVGTMFYNIVQVLPPHGGSPNDADIQHIGHQFVQWYCGEVSRGWKQEEAPLPIPEEVKPVTKSSIRYRTPRELGMHKCKSPRCAQYFPSTYRMKKHYEKCLLKKTNDNTNLNY
jgi:hypothetical protein